MNLALWVERAGKARADAPATAWGARVHRRYGELAERASRLAAGMRGLGLAPGARVALFAKNHPAYVEAMVAIWWAGLAAVPINNKLHRDEVAYILEASRAGLVFTTPDLGETAAAAAPATPLMDLEGAAYEALIAGAEPAPVADAGLDDLAWLFFTSGTTGRPKGAMLSHRNLLTMTTAYLADVAPVAEGDACLHAAPMSHGSGLYILPHLAHMGVNVVPESGGFGPAEIVELLTRWPRAAMFAAPTMLNRLVRWEGEIPEAALRNLKAVIYGGAPMYVEDAQAALERLGPRLVQIYGQGESPMTITCLRREEIADREHPDWLTRLGSAGRPYVNVEVRVVDADGRPVAPGESGEIACRGPSVMLGYLDDPEATARTIRDGWLMTGDVGAFDAAGYLTLMDRSKDLIISGGTNIYPREVEEALLTHPGVDECSVIGRRDADWGEIVVAYVVGRAGEDELDAWCLERMARFKRPKAYVFVDELPKNNYGKILKTELRERDAARTEPLQGGVNG
ncbi:MAG: AMP-binding protein [Alphaproteobacteria bacterium]|nr:AMP-binding protein [Alphaproteobacteria bacterium]